MRQNSQTFKTTNNAEFTYKKEVKEVLNIYIGTTTNHKKYFALGGDEEKHINLKLTSEPTTEKRLTIIISSKEPKNIFFKVK